MQKSSKMGIQFLWSAIGTLCLVLAFKGIIPISQYSNVEGGFSFGEYVFLGNVLPAILLSLSFAGIVSIIHTPITCFDGKGFPKFSIVIGLVLAGMMLLFGKTLGMVFHAWWNFPTRLIIALLVGGPFIIGAVVTKIKKFERFSKLGSVFVVNAIFSIFIAILSFLNSAMSYYLTIKPQAWVLGPIVVALAAGAIAAIAKPVYVVVVLIFEDR